MSDPRVLVLDYTTAGAYTVPIPAWARTVRMWACGAGGGGAGGSFGSSDVFGGGGGASGSVSIAEYAISDIIKNAPYLDVSVGTGGTGGASGASGGAGSNSTVSCPLNGPAKSLLWAERGLGGSPVGTGGTASGSNSVYAGINGASSSKDATPTRPANNPFGPGGGGAGGGIDSGLSGQLGGPGGYATLGIAYPVVGDSTEGQTAGADATDVDATYLFPPRSGHGGGGGASQPGGAGDGGDGGDSAMGGGGGGGGASFNGAGGAGGRGGDGWVRIIFQG